MVAQNGKDLLIKMDMTGSGLFETVAGLRATRVSFNAESVDVTSLESQGGWRELLAGAGVKSASKELWIPYEAITAVYPETKAAFLAIKGDETEALGWTAPPEGMTRGKLKHVSAADKVK